MMSCHESELEKYMVWLKQHMKLYKAIFHKYATVSQNKLSVKKLTFDDMRDQKNTMSLTEVFAFLNDFNMNKNFTIKRDDIKKVIKLINLIDKHPTHVKNSADLDLYGFIELILQLSHFVNGNHPKPSVFLPMMFNYLKNQSLASIKPLFQRLFEDPHASSIGDPQLLKQLQKHVNEDPNYQLPHGFIKYKQPAVVNSYKAPEEKTDNEKMVIELLDDIFKDTIGIHLLDPQMELKDGWMVKPDIF